MGVVQGDSTVQLFWGFVCGVGFFPSSGILLLVTSSVNRFVGDKVGRKKANTNYLYKEATYNKEQST